MENEIVLNKQADELYDVRISVSKVLSEHYQKILDMRDRVLDDPESENKDITAILQATTSIIKEMAKIQSDLYNSERVAVFLQVTVDELKKIDESLAGKVVQRLEERYEEFM